MPHATIANVRTLLAFTLVWMITVMPGAAQGKSGSSAGKKNGGAAAAAAATVSPATATAATSAPSTSANSVLYYGSWLDDASVMAPGTVWLGASTAYWKADTARQVDAPVLMGGMALARRAQVGASLPIYHFRDQDGFAASGVGTVSFYGKVMLIDPAAAKNGVGLAVAPLVEVAQGADQGFGWALPVNVEVRADRFRVYGSGGYFSRGSVFGTVAVEVPTGRQTALTGNFGQSHASGSHQTSMGVTLSYFPASATSFFVSLGHSSAAEQLENGGVSVGGGVSLLLPSKKPQP